MAGTSVDLLFFPIDTIKTRLQSSQGFLRAGGFSGMYKGVGSVMVGSAPGGRNGKISRLSQAYNLVLLKLLPFSQRMR